MIDRVAFRKTSLIDFPGRVAASLFLPGCDFRCPYCHNAALVGPDASARAQLSPLGEFLAFLDKRRGLLSGVVISGGEPLIHEELPRLAAAIRERGFAIKLDTNGSFPERIEPVAPDYVALDFKTAPSAYGLLAPDIEDAGDRLLESLDRLRSLKAEGRLDFEIRMTCAPGILDESHLQQAVAFFQPEDRVILQAFSPGGCLDPGWDEREPYSPARMERMLAIAKAAAPMARIRGR